MRREADMHSVILPSRANPRIFRCMPMNSRVPDLLEKRHLRVRAHYFLELGDIIGRGVGSSIHYLSVAIVGRWYFFGLSFFHSNVSSRHVFAGGGRQDVAIQSHRQAAVDAIFSSFD